MKKLKAISKKYNPIRLFVKLIGICDYLQSKNYHFILSILLFILLFFFAVVFNKYKYNREIDSFDKLKTLLDNSEYKLNLIRQKKLKVPRVFIKYFPKDFTKINNKYLKKDMFIKVILPPILKVNEEIMKERNKLLTIRDKLKNKVKITSTELNFIKSVSQKYKVHQNDLDELITRVDKIPVSLAMAQAIQETGWGVSYFLLKGNSLFAEWTWKYDGMVPRDRDLKSHHRIKTFPTLLESVRSYATILNSSKYYKKFRNTRKNLNKKGEIYTGINLGDTIKHYSTTHDYLFFVKKIIIENALTDFDYSELR